jgi:hypothetical protein|eukprot:COSAG01_NODE_7384_length_3229_cov_16.488498_1_plen_107_part_00
MEEFKSMIIVIYSSWSNSFLDRSYTIFIQNSTAAQLGPDGAGNVSRCRTWLSVKDAIPKDSFKCRCPDTTLKHRTVHVVVAGIVRQRPVILDAVAVDVLLIELNEN